MSIWAAFLMFIMVALGAIVGPWLTLIIAEDERAKRAKREADQPTAAP